MSADSLMKLLPPDWLRVLSVPPRPAEAPSLQGDSSRVPLTTTGLLSGRSSAAFRGLTELKSTAERQPMKPEEAGRESCGSSSESGERTTRIMLLYTVIFCPRSFLSQGRWTSWKNLAVCWRSASRLSACSELSRLKGCFLLSILLFLPCTCPRINDLMPFNSTSDVRLKSSLLFSSI